MKRESTTFWPLWWPILMSRRVQTTLNHIRCVHFNSLLAVCFKHGLSCLILCESLGELQKAVETLPRSLYYHIISYSPKLLTQEKCNKENVSDKKIVTSRILIPFNLPRLLAYRRNSNTTVLWWYFSGHTVTLLDNYIPKLVNQTTDPFRVICRCPNVLAVSCVMC